MKYHMIKRDLGHICRQCLNEQYHIKLIPNDCYYHMYPAVCDRCKQMKNIVKEIRFKKRLKIRLGL